LGEAIGCLPWESHHAAVFHEDQLVVVGFDRQSYVQPRRAVGHWVEPVAGRGHDSATLRPVLLTRRWSGSADGPSPDAPDERTARLARRTTRGAQAPAVGATRLDKVLRDGDCRVVAERPGAPLADDLVGASRHARRIDGGVLIVHDRDVR